jgi:hypothetical protein
MRPSASPRALPNHALQALRPLVLHPRPPPFRHPQSPPPPPRNTESPPLHPLRPHPPPRTSLISSHISMPSQAPMASRQAHPPPRPLHQPSPTYALSPTSMVPRSWTSVLTSAFFPGNFLNYAVTRSTSAPTYTSYPMSSANSPPLNASATSHTKTLPHALHFKWSPMHVLKRTGTMLRATNFALPSKCSTPPLARDWTR